MELYTCKWIIMHVALFGRHLLGSLYYQIRKVCLGIRTKLLLVSAPTAWHAINVRERRKAADVRLSGSGGRTRHRAARFKRTMQTKQMVSIWKGAFYYSNSACSCAFIVRLLCVFFLFFFWFHKVKCVIAFTLHSTTNETDKIILSVKNVNHW